MPGRSRQQRIPSSVIIAAKNIKLLAMDVDGVLTGGEVIVLESGEEIKFWNAKDRLVLALVRDYVPDLQIAWITGRSSQAVSLAAQDLGVRFVVQKSKDKKTALSKIMDQLKLKKENVAYIGDDLIDLPAFALVGLSACPNDAVDDVKSRALYKSPVAGGSGVVRDVIEIILKTQGKWEPLVQQFLK